MLHPEDGDSHASWGGRTTGNGSLRTVQAPSMTTLPWAPLPALPCLFGSRASTLSSCFSLVVLLP